MNKDYSINYRDKSCRIPHSGYMILVDQLMLKPDDIIEKTIDLFISSGVDFRQIHLYVSYSNDGNHIINLMAL